MQFILIAIGIILVFIAFKLDNKDVENKKNNVSEGKVDFANLLEEKLNNDYDVKLDLIIEQIKELNMRFDNMEDSMILLSNKIDQLENKTKIDNSNINKGKRIEQKTEIKKDEKTKQNKTDENDINAIIYDLVQQGLSVDDISSELNIGKGEVLLRLGLKKAKI